MNQRIKQLAEQAGFYFYDMHNVDGEDLGETIESDNWSAAEKFAKLIVQECCSKIEREYKYARGEKTQWTMSQDVQDLLKKHFGVEE